MELTVCKFLASRCSSRANAPIISRNYRWKSGLLLPRSHISVVLFPDEGIRPSSELLYRREHPRGVRTSACEWGSEMTQHLETRLVLLTSFPLHDFQLPRFSTRVQIFFLMVAGVRWFVSPYCFLFASPRLIPLGAVREQAGHSWKCGLIGY